MGATATASYLTCLICDTENGPTQIQCTNCSAPMSLVRSTADRKPNLVTVLGDSNVGKTVYLGFLLDMLSQHVNEFEAVPKGAQSVDLSQTVISHMAWRMFPPKTPMESDQWHWAHYEVGKTIGRTKKWIDLVTPDVAGEAIAAEIASPATFEIIRSLLDKSSGLILLVDAAMAANGSSQPDFFALKLLSYIESVAKGRNRGAISTPIAVILTKADFVPTCFDNPRRFAEANLSRLWKMCQSRCRCVEFFASSVVGSLGFAAGGEVVTPVPLHTALRGILEPFEWIVDQV